MPYVDDWASFAAQAEALYRSRPLHTRYVLKYRHCDGKLVLKVTDDIVCLKFRTDQQADLKRVEALNNTFFRLMARGPDAEEDPAEAAAAAELQQPAGQGRKAKRRG